MNKAMEVVAAGVVAETLGRGLEGKVAFFKKFIGEKYYGETTTVEATGLPKGSFIYVDTASADNIRRFVDAVGDLNPRFRDSDYARNTKYGRLVAPSLFSAAVCGAYTLFINAPDSRPMDAGSEWEFFQPVLEGDKFDYRGMGTASVGVRKSRFSGQMLEVTSIAEIRNQRGEVVSLAKAIIFHASSDQTAVIMGKYKDIKPHRYSEEELRKIEEDYEKEEMRGSQPRYWEDVVEGESIPHIVLGPRSSFDTLTWAAGCPHVPYWKGSRLYRMMVKGGTFWWYRDPLTNGEFQLEMPHFDPEFAKRVGMPDCHDNGPERECQVAVLFDNWMGDDGFLWKYTIQFRLVIHGDTNWVRGKVIRKYIDDGKCCVDLEYWGDNQRGERAIRGQASVILPSKVYGPVKYPSPRSLEDVFPKKD